MKTTLAITALMCSILCAELPPRPPLSEIVNRSELIIQAEAVNASDLAFSPSATYSMITFRMNAVYKGVPQADPIESLTPPGKMVRCPLINVLILKYGGIGPARVPKYDNGKRYILFLGNEVLQFLYVRSQIDARYEETPWTEDIEKEVKSLVLTSGRREPASESLRNTSDPNESQNLTQNMTPDRIMTVLHGKWVDHEHDWALIFKGSKVSEFENDAIQNECEYVVDVASKPLKMSVVENGQTVVAFKMVLRADGTLELEEAASGERAVLIREKE